VNEGGTTNRPSETETFFDTCYVENDLSPIDNFFDNTKDLNILISVLSTIPSHLQKKNFNLILLGQISAVESYLREIIRKLIIHDIESKQTSAGMQLSYGAALNYTLEVLPEALMEQVSFASKKNIINTFKDFLNIKGHLPNEVSEALEEFEKICQLRHCVIHRFGKLGSNNALKLGIDVHAECLEKPLSLEEYHLYDTYIICKNLVLVLNSYLFKSILQRTTVIDGFWTWDLRKDKKKFRGYYKIFKSDRASETPAGTLNLAYQALKEYYEEERLGNTRRRNR
jgi:hypothetical protein